MRHLRAADDKPLGEYFAKASESFTERLEQLSGESASDLGSGPTPVALACPVLLLSSYRGRELGAELLRLCLSADASTEKTFGATDTVLRAFDSMAVEVCRSYLACTVLLLDWNALPQFSILRRVEGAVAKQSVAFFRSLKTSASDGGFGAASPYSCMISALQDNTELCEWVDMLGVHWSATAGIYTRRFNCALVGAVPTSRSSAKHREGSPKSAKSAQTEVLHAALRGKIVRQRRVHMLRVVARMQALRRGQRARAALSSKRASADEHQRQGDERQQRRERMLANQREFNALKAVPASAVQNWSLTRQDAASVKIQAAWRRRQSVAAFSQLLFHHRQDHAARVIQQQVRRSRLQPCAILTLLTDANSRYSNGSAVGNRAAAPRRRPPRSPERWRRCRKTTEQSGRMSRTRA